MASDKAVRGKYLFLMVGEAFKTIRARPTLAELEELIEVLQSENPEMDMPTEDLFSKTGALLGRLANMSYAIIHNYELGDHNERKIAAASVLARRNQA